jgi:uncharacterized protein YjbJ (UPF0337 family)
MPTCLITGRRRQMTKDILEGNWKVYANNILQHWDKLTKDDLQRTGGQRESLAAKLQGNVTELARLRPRSRFRTSRTGTKACNISVVE